MSWRLLYTKAAQKDGPKRAAAGLKERTAARLGVLSTDPFQSPPPDEHLVGAYSRRISIQHRLAYQIVEDEHVVKVLRMWSHHE